MTGPKTFQCTASTQISHKEVHELLERSLIKKFMSCLKTSDIFRPIQLLFIQNWENDAETLVMREITGKCNTSNLFNDFD